MDKGINTIIEEAKNEFSNLVNSKIQIGLPISVINLILEVIIRDMNSSVKFAMEREAKEHTDHQEKEENENVQSDN